MKFFVEARKYLIGAIAGYIILKIVFSTELVTPYIEQIILYTFIVILASLGLNVIYGYTGQFSLGHAAFYGIGAYTSAALCHVFNIESAVAYIPILIGSGLVAAAVGYVVGLPILRLKDDFLAIATLGFGIFVRVILDNSDKALDVLGGSRGFVGIPAVATMEITYIACVFLILITNNLITSRYGLFWRSIREDELAASSVGINTFQMKLVAFTFGCFLAGVAGSLYAHLYTFLHPSNFDVLKSIDFLIIVIVGGMGSIRGTILAGLIWVGFIEGLRIVLPKEYLDLRWVVIPLLLILLMMWRPYGLIVKNPEKR